MNNIFRTVNLRKFYEQTKSFALQDLSLTVKKGEFVGIKGPSGSGKSTLLYILAGLLKPTSGEIYFKEQPFEGIKNKALYRRHNIGFVFQDFYLYPNFTVLENMLFPCMQRLFVPGSIIKNAERHLESLHMQDKRNARVESLSAGERQRACIARALLYEPECIFADEPTGNLDSQNAKNTLGLLKKLNDDYKTTILLVTHDEMISHYAHRIVHIIDGSLKKE
ncbi:MAG: ABC transporter ATP-binding protein [Candidatus Omnitrophica bacterium]|nr:ABC transporter ATP-binding protein [Candidatus Omnitrophota bacterium]